MAPSPPRYSIGRPSNVSTADSGVVVQEQHEGEKDPLYSDLRYYISRKRQHWLFTRDIELARPLQQKFLTFEAEVMEDIHEIERDRESKHQRRAREMDGATGIIKVSWKLYELKVRLFSKWTHYQLHRRWKHRHLNAKKKELSEEYVRAQMERRMNMIKEAIYFANEEVVENSDDGAFIREGLLNYIMTGYDSIFPIARDLEVDMSRT